MKATHEITYYVTQLDDGSENGVPVIFWQFCEIGSTRILVSGVSYTREDAEGMAESTVSRGPFRQVNKSINKVQFVKVA